MCRHETPMNDRTNSAGNQWLPYVIILTLALAAFVTALVPINSNDFWWHLKTGDYIRATCELPAVDPFSWHQATDSTDPLRARVILQRYWLAQVFYSWVHEVWGVAGIVWVRAAVCAGMVLATALFLWRAAGNLFALIPLVPLVLALRVILEDSDRPHLLAFAILLLLIVILESTVRSGQCRVLFIILPMQLTAAQLHPGFAVGTLIVCIYAACSLWEPRLQELRRSLQAVAGICLLLFFLNPNGLDIVPHLFGSFPSGGTAIPLEFLSPLKIWPYVIGDPGWLACGCLLFLSLPTVWFFCRRHSWSIALVLSGLTLAFLLAVRYVGFFAPVVTFFSGMMLGSLRSARSFPAASHLTAAGLIVATLFMMAFPGHANRWALRQGLQPGYFPVRAADFLVQQKGPIKLFNYDAWGGYLEFRLWPQTLVFADTRFLTEDVSIAYAEVVNDTPKGREFMQQHTINTVIFPPLDIYTGEVYPLVRKLSEDPQWSLVHFDDTALIFARQPHDHAALAKEMVWFQVLRQVNGWQSRFPWAPGYERTRLEAMMRMRGD